MLTHTWEDAYVSVLCAVKILEISLYACVCACICMCVCLLVCACVCVRICVCLCVYVFLFAFISECVLCVYMHIICEIVLR